MVMALIPLYVMALGYFLKSLVRWLEYMRSRKDYKERYLRSILTEEGWRMYATRNDKRNGVFRSEEESDGKSN